MSNRDVLSGLGQLAVSTLGIPAGEMDNSTSLLEYGIDSLMLIRFGQEIERRFSVKLKLEWFFRNQPSLKTLADHIAELSAEFPPRLPVETPSDNVEYDAKEPLSTLNETSPNNAEYNTQEPVSTLNVTSDTEPESSTFDDDALASLFRMQTETLESLFTHQLSVLTSQAAASDSVRGSGPRAPSSIMHDFRNFKLTPEEGLTPGQESFIDSVVTGHIQKTGKSRDLTQKHRSELADWKNTLSFRMRLKEAMYPIISDSSNGARFTDLDGNEYIDIALGMGVNFMGHRHPKVVAAVEKRLETGFELGPQCSMTGKAAELVASLTGMERVCFCNTGSEAVMVGIRLARAKTGRNKVVIFNGSYHGIFDGVLGVEEGSEVMPLSPGTPPGMVEDIVMLDYDSSSSLSEIEGMADGLAAVLVEPVQSRRPGLQPQTFLRRLRKLTKEKGIALIFDEMVNGFRIAPGGAQEYFGIRADIGLYGKALGGGVPVGVIAGSAEYMAFIDGGLWQFGDDSLPGDRAVVFGGTFCRHPFAMEAVTAVAGTMLVEGPALQNRVNHLADLLADELNIWFQDEYVPLRVTHFGSQFKFESYGPWTLLANPIELDLLFMLLLDEGIYTWEHRTCCLSVAHTEDDIRTVIRTVKSAVRRLRNGGFSFRLERGAPESFGSVTSVQKRIFAAMQHENGQAPYHMPAAWFVRGETDVELMEICFGEIIKRHECLRSGFRVMGGRLTRTVVDEPCFFIERISSDGRDPEQIISDFIRPFDLEHPPLIRVGIAEIDDTCSLLMFDSLHIVVDGISLATLTRELNALYNGDDPPVQGASYSHYMHYMQDFEAGDRCSEQLAYWTKVLVDKPSPLTFSRKTASTNRGLDVGHIMAVIKPGLRERIRKAAASCGATTYLLMLAAYAALMRSLAGTSDMVVGIATAGRPEERFNATIGMFVNTLPLRLTPGGGQSFRGFLDCVREACADAYQHQDVPYELIAEKTGNTVGTMFTYEVADERLLDLSGLDIEEIDAPIPGSMFDLSLDTIEKNNAIHLDFEFDPDVLDEECVQMWVKCFIALIEEVCSDTDILIGSIPLMPDRIRDDYLSEWNDTRHDFDSSLTVVDRFLSVVSNRPDTIAVIDAEGGMTYAELDKMSDQAAEILLSEYMIGPESLVAVCSPPSSKLVASILGVLRAGGAFLPLEHNGPSARAEQILEDAGINLLIGCGELFDELDVERTCDIVNLTDPDGSQPSQDLQNPTPESLAYVIYTSGSTGRPKGCEIEHASLYNYVVWAMEHYFSSGDAGHFCLTSPLAFDMSLMTLFVPLCLGKTLRIPDISDNPAEALACALSPETETDVLNLTPSHIRVIGGLELDETNVRIAVVGGETLRPEDVETLLHLNPTMEIHNEYGPTEATIGCTSQRIHPDESLSIGCPVYNTSAYIIDTDMRLLPPGAWGELCIGGAGLARGYRNMPELTREKFVISPIDGERIYCTGDRARRMKNGRIELGGRIDDQLKIGGYRIEPGEIEGALVKCDGVSEAVVVYRNGLSAFITGECIIENVQLQITGFLPSYMVPQRIEKMDELPVSSSGKIDKKELMRIAGDTARNQLRSEGSTPANPVLDIMRDISGNPAIGMSDNFFSAGGNSLDAVAVVARCRKELGLTISLRDFFVDPTAETINKSDEVSSEPGMLRTTSNQGNIPQTSGQKQIWIASQLSGTAYNMTEMFLLEGELDSGLLEASFAELIKRHEILRTSFHGKNGELYQKVHPFTPERLHFDHVNLSGQKNPEQAAVDLADEESFFRFDLEQGPLMRIILMSLDSGRYMCLLNIHHIITDGWSTTFMLDELSRIYQAGGFLSVMPAFQYHDFAVWHSEYITGKDAEKDLEYWREALKPPVTRLSLPGRADRTGSEARKAAAFEFEIGASLLTSLDILAGKSGATLFMTLLAGLTVVFHQRTSAEDIIVGTPAAGRLLPELETMPGYFLNTLPLRMSINGGMSFRELLRDVVRNTSEAFAHQLYPFDVLVEKCAGSQGDGRNPFFDAMLILQNTAEYRFSLPNVRARRFYAPRSREAKFEIMIELETAADCLSGIIEYDTAVYTEGCIEKLAGDLVAALEHITRYPDKPVSSLFALLSQEDGAARERFLKSISDVSEEF